MTTLKDKNVKIRKQQQCFSCLRIFDKGTILRYWVGILDGDFNSVYSCSTCDSLMSLSDENEYPKGFVKEWCNDENIDTPELLLNKRKRERL